MNISNIAHGGLAIAAQIVTALTAVAFGADFFEGAVLGAMLSIGFYWGREVAQAERKAGGKPWYVGFDVTRWSSDAVFDLVFPVVGTQIVSAAVYWMTKVGIF